jgi:hypothetical protein
MGMEWWEELKAVDGFDFIRPGGRKQVEGGRMREGRQGRRRAESQS